MNQVLTLGELTDMLRIKARRLESTAKIRFDFVYFYSKGIHSYRGDYSQLAIGYEKDGDAPLVTDVLKMLEDAEGKEFTGYKGGEFDMTRGTLVWVALSNESGQTGIVDVIEDCGDLILVTAHVD